MRLCMTQFLMLLAMLSTLANCRTHSNCTKRATAPKVLVPGSPESLVQKQLDAYNARDIEAFVSHFHPEIEVFSFPAAKRKLQGHTALRKMYSKLFTDEKLHCHLVNRIVQGHFVIDREEVTFAHGPKLQATAIYQIEDNLIRKVWFLY